MGKKKLKSFDHANYIWERDQLKAATIAENLNKAIATIELYKDELEADMLAQVELEFKQRKHDLEQFIMNAKTKYLKKLQELGFTETGDKVTDTVEEQ
jgi:hypothetical protein